MNARPLDGNRQIRILDLKNPTIYLPNQGFIDTLERSHLNCIRQEAPNRLREFNRTGDNLEFQFLWDMPQKTRVTNAEKCPQ